MKSRPDGPIRVVVIDDNLLALMGVRVGLRAFSDLHVIGSAVTGAEGVELVAAERPDVALIDLLLPDMTGSAVARLCREVSPPTRTIIFTGELASTRMSQPLPRSVDGYFHKTGKMPALAALIRGFNGQPQPEVDARPDSPGDRWQTLNLREQEILLHLANGLSLKEAAQRMQVSIKSADHLKQSLMSKLGVHNRVELLLYAIHAEFTEARRTLPAPPGANGRD